MQEEPELSPVCSKIFELLRQNKELINHHYLSSNDPSRSYEDEAAKLHQSIRDNEFDILAAIISLHRFVEQAISRKGESTRSIHLIRQSRLFAYANEMLQHRDDQDLDTVATLYHVGAEGEKGGPCLIFFAHRINSQMQQRYVLSMDLLQYWEILLRYELRLNCKEFCYGIRKSLCTRIGVALQREQLLKKLLNQPQGDPENSSRIAIRKDIIDRLSRITLRVNQLKVMQENLRLHRVEDFPEKVQVLRQLNRDDHYFALSELVHLADNVKKHLLSTGGGVKSLAFVENLTCYRVAKCFVNTKKHGVRGRNKDSAVDEYDTVVADNGTIVELGILINHNGEAYQGSILIDDLINVWEIFLRYYIDIEFDGFRKSMSERFSSRLSFSEYSVELNIESELKRTATERLHYDI